MSNKQKQDLPESLSSLKKHFCETLKKYIKASGIRQVDLAMVLNLSPSAVSQMLSGRINPNLKQLDAMTQLLSLDRKECADLRDCLLRIRSGDDELRSPLNDFIKSLRTRHGLSIEQLACMTGIPVDTLFMLENKLNVQPTPQEAVRLAAVFGCSHEEFWQVVPEYNMQSEAEKTLLDKNTPPWLLVMHEASGPSYKADGSYATKTPVIKFNDLRYFDVRCDYLVEFAWRHMCRHLDEHKVGLVVVEASGRDFGWDDLYTVQLEIAEAEQWISGMTVIGMTDEGTLVLGKALGEVMNVVPMGSSVVIHCQHCWLVNSLCFTAEILNFSDKKNPGLGFNSATTVLQNNHSSVDNSNPGENQ